MPALRRKHRFILAFAAALFAALAAAYASAPYLPRLAAEGYPSDRWPSAGSHLVVKGVQTPILLQGETTPPSERATALFTDNGGRALLVWQGGDLRSEFYDTAAGPDTRFNSFSMVKSLVGALVLRAHAEGLIAELSDPIGRYLPDIGDAGLRAVPIERFLTMRSGVTFEAGTKVPVGFSGHKEGAVEFNPFGPMVRLHMLGLGAVSNRLHSENGSSPAFNYQNVNTAILGHLISTLYAQPLESIVSEKIWQPSGAGDAFWRRPSEDLPVSAYCCLYATARDWVRVGVFMLQNGTDDAPFMPDQLWKQFFGSDVSSEERHAGTYGTHVYQNVLDRSGEPLQGPFTYMMGRGGQITYMMPERNLVVVRFGERIPLLHSTLYAAWDSVPSNEPVGQTAGKAGSKN
ncbi:serine hydrolase domain-containing protein [Hoeflea prorocentri]|uniref:Serine hydrolase n=1 Tax=Hoeflea prorocentri TaxID=1922333 RepID=A0A9X3ZHT5_9HYPH|nr:serine hydrolase [Hoeflea prorocentri]MCY6381166.1 serine hydrolase [Hoeflea prorocentri]MDA5398966.1 serine hydrolase [Hoeflea prorocentri]